MKTLTKVFLILGLMASASLAQLNTVTATTLSAAITATQTTNIPLTSVTGIVASSYDVGPTVLYVVDVGQTVGEAMKVTAVNTTLLTVSVSRTGPGKAVAHASGTQVLIGVAANWFYSVDPAGSCTASTTYVTPYFNIQSGRQWACSTVTGTWVPNNDSEFYVPPTQCTTAPTTSTVTNTYPVIGSSNVFVLNATTNAAAGTTTLVCNILLPTRVTSTRGVVITDITVAVGSQTNPPTSIGTATLGSITFPTPKATTQTASTVTPVTIGGTVTQLGPTTTVLTATTAGAFLTFKYTFSTAVQVSGDLQMLQFTVPYLNSAASAMTLNWPGLFVHYIAPAF